MADIREYKCPACGGAMEFDSKTQKMKCPYCDTVADLSDFEETQSEKTASKEGAEQGETQEAADTAFHFLSSFPLGTYDLWMIVQWTIAGWKRTKNRFNFFFLWYDTFGC